jgi:D-glycero-beta-D-manno-heptose 1-phosphate adenylyltransferase
MKLSRSPELKIIELSGIPSLRQLWEEKKSKVVFTNGCFDIVHRGHLDYLIKASGFGDILFIGLNSDGSVKRLKGENRPLQDQASRALLLASMEFIDYVCIFSEDTPYELIKAVQPDVLVKGSDYKPKEIIGYDIVKAKNGEVVTVDLTQGYSSTGIINRM